VAYDKYADSFQKRFDVIFHEVAESFFQRFIQKLSGKRVLDLGSGGGSNAIYLQRDGLSVICQDISPEMIKRCQEKGLKTVQGDMEEVEFMPASFDGIWAYCSLLHLKKENLPTMVERTSIWLASGGILGVALLDEGRADESREDKSYPGVKRWFSYYTYERLLGPMAIYFIIFIFCFKRNSFLRNVMGTIVCCFPIFALFFFVLPILLHY
jgi:SAM-dependent methyltransferase